MSPSHDLYEVLGVARTASDADIKAAFRKIAMQCHPDRNPGDAAAEARFKEANVAHEILKDPQKRAAYDQYGMAAFQSGGGGGGAGFQGFDFGFAGSFSDLFEEMFGDFAGANGGRGGTGRARGGDQRANVTLTLDDAFHGKQIDLTLPTLSGCDTCQGSGCADGSTPVTCPTCKGAGRVRASQGFFTIQRTCSSCQGMGQVIEKPCRPCGGTGRVRREKKLSVAIPAGVEDGNRIRLGGEGEAGPYGGPAGDLYLFVSVAPHALFRREGDDLFCRVPIPMTKAALGATIDVPLIDGEKTSIDIPAGTQSGSQFRLKEKGMTILRSRRRGDMYIEAVVETPVKLDKEQRAALETFAALCGDEKTHPESQSFLKRVGEFWTSLTERDAGASNKADNKKSARP